MREGGGGGRRTRERPGERWVKNHSKIDQARLVSRKAAFIVFECVEYGRPDQFCWLLSSLTAASENLVVDPHPKTPTPIFTLPAVLVVFASAVL